jgi:hypothetical protein
MAKAAPVKRLTPDFVSTVNLHVGLPNALDLRRQSVVALGSCTASVRLALKRRIPSIPGWGNLQNLADRLDPNVSRCSSMNSLRT